MWFKVDILKRDNIILEMGLKECGCAQMFDWLKQ